MVYKIPFYCTCGGAVDGKLYTNSLEAMEQSYILGNRVFDMDIEMTKDGKLVLRHSWNDNLETSEVAMHDSKRYVDMNGCQQYTYMNEAMDYEEFINTPIFYKYHSMSCLDMLKFMDLHQDLYVSIDMKTDVVNGYKQLVDLAKSAGMEEVLKRIIINVYDYEMYDRIMEIHPFENTVVRQFFSAPNNYYELAEFCLKNDIHVVNISSCYIEHEGVKLLQDKGIHIYVAIVDYISDMKEFHDVYGATGAVTNLLYENDWNYIKQ